MVEKEKGLGGWGKVEINERGWDRRKRGWDRGKGGGVRVEDRRLG